MMYTSFSFIGVLNHKIAHSNWLAAPFTMNVQVTQWQVVYYLADVNIGPLNQDRSFENDNEDDGSIGNDHSMDHNDGNDDLLHVLLYNRTVRTIFLSPMHPPAHSWWCYGQSNSLHTGNQLYYVCPHELVSIIINYSVTNKIWNTVSV